MHPGADIALTSVNFQANSTARKTKDTAMHDHMKEMTPWPICMHRLH